MFVTIRKNQQFLTTLVVGLTIIAFIWLYNRTNLSQVGMNDVFRLYGRVIQRSEVDARARQYQLAIGLGEEDLVKNLSGFAASQEAAASDFVINGLILEHQAEELQIEPTEEQIAAAIKEIPLFQEKGAFSPQRYQQIVEGVFAKQGLTQRELEEMIRQSLRLKRIYQLITSPVAISEGEVRDVARIYQPITCTYVTWNREDYLPEAKKMGLSDKEEQTFYQTHQQEFMTEENRSFEYLTFELPTEKQQLKGKEKIAALQEIANKATELRQNLIEELKNGKNFSDLLKERGLQAQKTASLNRQGVSVEGIQKKENSTTLPPFLTEAGFKLAGEGQVSDAIQSGDRFYLLLVEHITPARPMSFEEVKPRIEEALWNQRATALMNTAAQRESEEIKLKLQKEERKNLGTAFPKAIEAEHKKVQRLQNINPSKMIVATLSPQERSVVKSSLLLKEGELSALKVNPSGNFLVYLDKRTPLSSADWEAHHQEIEERALSEQKTLYFMEWLMHARKNAGILILQGGKTGR